LISPIGRLRSLPGRFQCRGPTDPLIR